MPALHIDHVPDDLYAALEKLARQHGRSVAAEALSLLAGIVPTPEKLARRLAMLDHVQRLRSAAPDMPGPFPSAEDMQREDRDR